MIDFDVDLVVPFVDNNDPVWQKTYNSYCSKFAKDKVNKIASARYDNPGFFKYALKLIDKFMPWVRKIFLIVSNIEQVPDYINKEKTVIVLHKDIIPARFLPTFNSTTIEMYIHNIEGLSEHFIYTNDDMYPIKKLSKEDFFAADGKIRVNFTRESLLRTNNQFRKVCAHSYNDVAMLFGNKVTAFDFWKPDHSMSPMILSDCKACFNQLQRKIEKYIGAFRTDLQRNQYMYTNYSSCMNHVDYPKIKFVYTSVRRPAKEIEDILFRSNYQIVCINDVGMRNRSLIPVKEICNLLERLLDSKDK